MAEIFHLYGLLIGLGILGGSFVSEKIQKRLQKYCNKYAEINLEQVLSFVVIPAIIGARAYHVIDYWVFYRQNFGQVLMLWNGGLGIWGGLLGGILGVFFYSKIKKKNIWLVLDLVSFGLLVGQMIGRLGNFFNSELFGKPTDLAWGIFIKEELRPIGYKNYEKFHPLFFYEIMINGLALLLLLKLSKKKRKIGFFVSVYFISYGLTRFFLDFLRIRNWQVIEIGISQIISVVFILIGIIKLIYKGKINKI